MTALAARLATLAAKGETITYGALARDLGWRIGDLTEALEAGMEEDAGLGRPLLAAVCAQRLSALHLPAPGFFIKAAALGRSFDDPAEAIRMERARLQQVHGKGK